MDLKAKDEERNMTALHFACQSGHPKIVEYLIDECPELVMMRDSNNYLPLHMCSLYFTQYTFQIIEILLEDETLIQSMTEWDWYMNIRNAVVSGVYELYVFWIDYLRSESTLSYLLQPERMHAFRDSKDTHCCILCVVITFELKTDCESLMI